MRLARRGDLMQRAAGKAAAKRRVDAVDAEGQAARFAAEDGGFFQGAQTLRNCSSIIVKPLETRKNLAKRQEFGPIVHYLF